MSNSLELIFVKARNAEKRGDHAEAAALYEAILRRFPANARARKLLAALPGTAGEAEVSLPRADFDALLALYKQGRLAELVVQGEPLAARYPRTAVLHNMLGAANLRLQRPGQAADAFRAALAAKSDYAEAHNHLGIAFKQLGQPAEALASYEQALRVNPDYADAHNNMGNLLKDLGRRAEAVIHYERALQIKADYPDANNNLGNMLQELGRLDEALACYARAIEARPDYAAARAQQLHLWAHMCDWEALAADAGGRSQLGVVGEPVPPFIMLTLDDNPERNRSRAERFCAGQYRMAPLPPFATPAPRGEKLRIGYFSADFHDHATMYLMARMFELHDRDRFEIHIFSYGPARNDEMRQRLRRAVDAFHDVAAMDDRQVAALARDEGIDIAVDLKGYTAEARLGILAWRPAPIQISYLGYPGTLGAPFIDYIVADKIVIPDEQRRHYAESIIYLPGSYQVNDDHRRISAMMTTRAECGLPEDGFVFCCFNNSYKITPREFDIWMRLLGRIEGSVFWLLRANRWAEANLRKEAARRGIDPDRLVFAHRLPQAEHLARQRLADLFLDSFDCNAHTTASDALWAGLPVLTRPGRGFAARVAASLLDAVGLSELVVATLADYERLAVELAGDRARLSAVRTRLAANLPSAPLFQTERFVRQLEAAYDRVHADRAAGKAVADIAIDAA